jgi:RNA polymerase sigma-70 factor, ECF subfamily
MGPAADEPDPRLGGDSDGELLRRIAERDTHACEIFYGRYARAVYGLELRRLHDHERAEDATRRAFAAIWRSAASYDSGDVAAWVYTVARDAAGEAPDGAVADGDWLAFRVHAAVGELPAEERAPLELAYWEGRGPGEIAQLLGLSPGTVKKRTRRALAHLAVWLDGLR